MILAAAGGGLGRSCGGGVGCLMGSMGGGSGKSGGDSENGGRYIVHTRYIVQKTCAVSTLAMSTGRFRLSVTVSLQSPESVNW